MHRKNPRQAGKWRFESSRGIFFENSVNQERERKHQIMNREKFLKLVKERANYRVQEKIRTFKEAIDSALRAVNPELCWNDTESKKVMLAVMETRARGSSSQWPRFLWEKEEELVEKEVFDTMDVMQRMLTCPLPKPDDVHISLSTAAEILKTGE